MKIPVETFLKNVDGQQRKKTQFDVISLDAENWTGLTQLKTMSQKIYGLNWMRFQDFLKKIKFGSQAFGSQGTDFLSL